MAHMVPLPHYTRRTWVLGFDRTHLDADAGVGKASCSGATAALFRLVIHANARTLKTENPCAAGIEQATQGKACLETTTHLDWTWTSKVPAAAGIRPSEAIRSISRRATERTPCVRLSAAG